MPVTVPDDFVQFLRVEQGRSVDTALEERRATALAFYDGRPYGDEVEGRSQAVTRDVSEVIDQQMVGILNTFLASGKAVEFETEAEEAIGEDGQPEQQQGPDGQPRPVMVDYGEEATAAVRYLFFRKQNGYQVLRDCLAAGQMEMSGIVKTYVEPQRPLHEPRQVLVDELVEDADGYLVDGLRVVEATQVDDLVWNVVVEVPQPPLHRDVAVPNEYFRVSPDATSLDEAVYVGERMQRSLSDLAKLGYDLAELEGVLGAGTAETTLSKARDANRSVGIDAVGNRTGVNKMVWLEEEYPLYDLNGDGIAERLFVHRVGNVVLSVMEVDEQPYSLWSPFPRQHRLIGDSTADKTMDIQRIRSVLLRQGLDSMYLANAPRTLVSEESMTVDTIDDLLTVRSGGLVRYKGSNPPMPLQQTDTSAIAFSGMEIMAGERESRTGVTRQSQGINPDVLNKTASGLAMNLAQAQQIELYVTRNFAEFIVAPMFAKRYRLLRKYGQPFRMKIEGKYRTINPARWPEDIDMQINVGLGTGNKDQKLAARMQLFEIQQGIVAAGGRIVGEEQVYQNLRGFVQDTGLGSPADYVLNPADLGPPPEQLDPDTAKAQADAATRQAKDQQAHEQAMGRLELQAREADARNELSARQQEFDLAAAREKEALRAELERARAEFEAGLARDRFEFDKALAVERLSFDQELKQRQNQQDGLPNLRPGGDLDK